MAGVDEAGRGPLAGPVTAAAVVLPADLPLHGVADSKQLTEDTREALYDKIRQKCLAYAVVHVGARRIEELNILQATMLAMRLAALRLERALAERFSENFSLYYLVDGNRFFCTERSGEPIIDGDAHVRLIGAASILAKVERDRLMKRCERYYPGYQLEKHKGYPTKEHRERIAELGLSQLHRRTFRTAAATVSIESSSSRAL